MLGGEVEVLNQLQMGAIQGMGVSSVAANKSWTKIWTCKPSFFN